MYLRTLPAGPQPRFAGRILSALVFAAAASGLVALTAWLTTPLGLDAAAWTRLVVALLAGSVPFGLLGIALGYWTHPRAALPLANLLYLALAYAGALWTGPGVLPEVVERISPVLPTRMFGEVVWSAALGIPWRAEHWLGLAAYGVVFGLLGAAGYRRDEALKYR